MSKTSTPTSGRKGQGSTSKKDKTPSQVSGSATKIEPAQLFSPKDFSIDSPALAAKLDQMSSSVDDCGSTGGHSPMPQHSDDTESSKRVISAPSTPTPVSTVDANLVEANLDTQFDQMSRRVEKLDSIIDPKNPASLLVARDELSNIIHDLETLLLMLNDNKCANVKTPSQKAGMMAEILELLQHTKVLKGHIDGAIGGGSNEENLNNNNNNDDDDDDDEEDDEDADDAVDLEDINPFNELSREEIGKLLLLVAKAYETKQINFQQRRVIKGHICRQAGYLRIILNQTDMSVIMRALSAIGEDTN